MGTALQFLTYTRDLTFVMDPGPKLNARCRQKLGSAGIPVRCGQVKRVQASDKHGHQVATAVHEGATAAMGANHVLYPPHQRL